MAQEGEAFRQVRGKPVHLRNKGPGCRLSATNQTLPKTLFAQALARVPLESTADVHGLQSQNEMAKAAAEMIALQTMIRVAWRKIVTRAATVTSPVLTTWA